MSRRIRDHRFKFVIDAEIPEDSQELREYVEIRIPEGKAYLGQTKYNPEGEISKDCYDHELNYFSGVGVIEFVGLNSGVISGKSVVPYSNDDYFIKPIYKDGKFKDFYLTRR